MTLSRPQISLNLALSADGRITSPAGRPSGWTSERDHQRLLQLRQAAEALIVGRGTLEADRMTLGGPHQPWRCVVSRSGFFDPGHPLFSSPGGPIHLLATAAPAPSIEGAEGHTGSLADFLAELHRRGIRRLHCEGGGGLARALAELDALDLVHLTWAGHTIFGGRENPGLTGPPGEFLSASLSYELTDFEADPSTGECFLSYRRLRT